MPHLILQKSHCRHRFLSFIFFYFLLIYLIQLRKLGDDDNENKAVEGVSPSLEDKVNWVAVPNSEGVVREVKERRVLSREEREESRETEDIQHLGDITDEVGLNLSTKSSS